MGLSMCVCVYIFFSVKATLLDFFIPQRQYILVAVIETKKYNNNIKNDNSLSQFYTHKKLLSVLGNVPCFPLQSQKCENLCIFVECFFSFRKTL